jgi:PrgI family protein
LSGRIRLPADVELEDRLAFGLTARQLLILSAAALICYATFAAAGSLLPLPLAAAASTPLGLVGVALALGRRDGMSGDRLAFAVVRHLSESRLQVAAEGLPAKLPGAPVQPALSLLSLPVRAILESGVVELADGSFCLLAEAAGTSWALRASEEQLALSEAFGNWLNSLVEPAAITVRSEPVDLATHAETVARAACELPNRAMRECATTYAGFLNALSGDGDLRRRQILVTLTARASDGVAARGALERRAREASGLLRQAGVELRVLDGERAAALLGRVLEPPGAPAGSQLTGVVRS